MVRALAALLCALLGLSAAQAQQYIPGFSPGFRSGFQFIGGAGGFPSPGSVVDYDFKYNRYTGPPITVSNASGGYIDDSSGNWTLVPPNTLRRSDKGVLIEGAQTNDALYARDLTQTVWTKTGATAALTQTGFEGAANSATLLTATAANGSATQAITSASSLRTTSVFLKRVTGSGAVQITQDNTNWTTCTVTAAFTRCQVSATVTNPTVGVRLATSGDAVAVDVVQDEIWSSGVTTVGGASSPIRTTGTAATRAADVVTATLPVPVTAATMAGVFREPAFGIFGSSHISINDGTSANSYVFRTSSGTATSVSMSGAVGGSGVTNPALIAGKAGDGARHAGAAAFAANDEAIAVDGSTPNTSASGAASVSLSTVQIGSAPGFNSLNGYIERLVIYPYRAANSNLQQQSTLANWGG